MASAYTPLVSGEPHRLLIVDNDEDVVRALIRSFRGVYAVTATTDPRVALGWIAQGERFSAIVSDLVMSGMSGAALYEEIEAIDPKQARRMVFFTGGAAPLIEQSLHLRGCTVLRKPVDLLVLSDLIVRIAREA